MYLVFALLFTSTWAALLTPRTPRFQEWQEVASSLKCQTEPSHYQHLFRLTQSFAARSWNEQKFRQVFHRPFPGGLNFVFVQNHTMHRLNKDSQGDERWWFKTRGELFADALNLGKHLLPSTFWFFDQTHDWPLFLRTNSFASAAFVDQDQWVPNATHSANTLSTAQVKRASRVASEYLTMDREIGELADGQWAMGHLLHHASLMGLPVFGRCTHPAFLEIPIPNSEYHLPLPQDKTRWDRKKPVAFFRGTGSGEHLHSARDPLALNRPRFLLTEWAEHANRIEGLAFSADVAMVGFFECRDPTSTEAKMKCTSSRRKYAVAPTVDQQRFWEHKYLLLTDGQAWSNRAGMYFQSHSLVLFHTLFDSWWSKDWFRPFEHYLPFRLAPFDSNLTRVLNWATAHDKEAQTIAERASELALRILRREDMLCYTLLAMLEYVEIWSVIN